MCLPARIIDAVLDQNRSTTNKNIKLFWSLVVVFFVLLPRPPLSTKIRCRCDAWRREGNGKKNNINREVTRKEEKNCGQKNQTHTQAGTICVPKPEPEQTESCSKRMEMKRIRNNSRKIYTNRTPETLLIYKFIAF